MSDTYAFMSPGPGTAAGAAVVESVFGRVGQITAQTGDYNFSQISGTVQATQLPLFTASVNGAVPASGGGTLNFLRADGTWSPLPVPVTLPNNTVLGNVSGAAAPATALTQAQLTAMLGLFTATTAGIVQASGGGIVNFLRADGQWVPPGGGGALPSIPNNTVLGNVSGGTAVPSDITGAQVNSFLPAFTQTANGTVPAPGAATPTTDVLFASGAWGALPAAPTPQLKLTTQVFTANGTYTPPAGLQWAVVECVGGGGGGGGVGNGGAAAYTGPAGGGASGGYSRSVLPASTIGTSQTITIGAAGAGGANSAAVGVAGGTTSFGSLVIANGGGGGNGYYNPANSNFGQGGVPGAVGSGQLAIVGNPGVSGIVSTAPGPNTPGELIFGGNGGSTFYGGAGRGGAALAADGSTSGGNPTAGTFGAGGGASVIVSSGTNAAGAAGGSGICIVTEYSF